VYACPQAVWNAYVLSMRQAGFTAAVPMYAASGLLTYGASEDMDHIIATLQAAGLCSEVLYKELYIPQAELDGVPCCFFSSVLLFVYCSRDLIFGANPAKCSVLCCLVPSKPSQMSANYIGKGLDPGQIHGCAIMADIIIM